jgi:hypothetical protein
MARKIDPSSERVLACQRAALALREEFGSDKAVERATGLTQQTLSALIKTGKLGLDFARQACQTLRDDGRRAGLAVRRWGWKGARP